MKITFPKIVREFQLSEYAPEVKGSIQVWVNPPVKVLDELAEAFKDYAKDNGQEKAERFLSVVSVLLSQHSDPATHWTLEELQQLSEGAKETDPAFWWWFHNRILHEIQSHRMQLKKA